jgi:hypothetical protein
MKERMSKAKFFRNLPWTDKKKKVEEREHKIMVLTWVVCYLPDFVFPQPP